MRFRRLAAITAVAAIAGGGAAIAATGDEDERRQTEQAILEDAAGRLDVSASDLRSALSAAQEAQIDRAVEEGDLTREQAERIKQHREESGTVLGGPGGPGGPGHHFGLRGVPGGPLAEVAEAIGISVEDLRSELREGKTLEEVAEAHDKSLDEVKAAVQRALEARLDEAVREGDLTERQADRMRERIPEMLERLGERPFPGRGGPGGPPPGAPEMP